MALDFNVLAQTPSVVQRFYQGQQDVQQEAERNMLRQQQQLQFQQQQEDRARIVRERGKREAFLTDFKAKFKAAGYDFDKEAIATLMEYGLEYQDSTALNLATKAQQALKDDEEYRRLFPSTPAAAAPAAAAPAAAAPAVANAMAPAAAAPANAMAPVDPYADERARLVELSGSGNARVAARAKAALGQLPKAPGQLSPEQQLVPVGRLVFDRATRQWIAPPADAPESSPVRQTTTKAPAPMRVRPGESVISPTGEVIYSAPAAPPKTPAPRGAAAPAGPEGALPQKEIDKREATYPKVTAVLRSFETNADTLIDKLTRLRDNPGLSGITGLVFGRTPAITPEARDALAELDTILARGGFAELAAMRQASPTGGALGNISNKEVEFLRSAFGSLDRVQDTETFKKKINDVIKQLQTSKRNVLEEYENTYAYRKARAAAGAGLTPDQKQALDWANKNPNDPRAAEIKKTLGM